MAVVVHPAGAAAPLRRGSAAEAAVLAGALERLGFRERTICARLDIPKLDGVDHAHFKSLVGRIAGAGAMEVPARLFLFGEFVDRDAVAAQLTPPEIDAFLAADLIREADPASPHAGRFFSPVRLVPVEAADERDLLLAGDRGDHPDGSPFVPFADIVFSGHNPLTRQFLRVLPRQNCGDVLDLCSGTAVAALAVAPYADRCTGVDVAERSTHFADFNVWLNQSDRVEVLRGDLYEPVAGRRFDRILAHPPYVPALTQRLTYRDGGETGEQIVQRVVSGVPSHLNEGGTFHLLCLGMDTADASFEQRVRGWLGDASDDFDVIFALDSRTPPELIATRLVDRSGGTPRDLERWRDLFQGLHVKEFVYGAVVGRRFTPRRCGEAFTRRVLLTDDTDAGGFEWLFGWFDWMRQPDRDERVLSLSPRLAPDVRLEVRHAVEQNAFVPAGYALSNGGRPFQSRLDTEAWVVALIAELDGSLTVEQAFDSARARGRAPADFTRADLARLACFLLERGFLTGMRT